MQNFGRAPKNNFENAIRHFRCNSLTKCVPGIRENPHFSQCKGPTAMSQPPVDEFANMLEVLFAGNRSDPQQPDLLIKPGRTLDELAKAIHKLKLDKAVDECGLAAELLKHLPDLYLQIDWICIIMCFAMVRCHQVGGEQCSPCWENMSGPNWYQTFDQLRVCGCCIKRLHT